MAAPLARLRAEAPILLALLVVAATAALAWVVRYQFVEPETLGNACEAANQGLWWCSWRTGFIVFTKWRGFGIGAGILAVLAVMAPPRLAFRFVVAAMVAGGMGLLLYDTAYAATAVLFAGLRAVRLQDAPN
ncbi:MAG: hypothetical protein H7841_04110 [Magnetospirillum sp. WYHS-4]